MDLEDSFAQDNSIISLITIISVFVILLFTFKSFGLPLILVAAIQGSIWINFSVPYITGERIFFLGYLIVSSIQMGATIDYAIVIANRYMTLRSDEDKVTAAARALDLSFPTVLTSGSILTIAGLLLGVVSTNPMISSLGTVLGRGTFISIIVVLTALPLILVLTDTFIQKSEFKLKTKREGVQERKKFRSQAAYVDGRIQGYVNGYIIGELHGVIRGDIDARIDIKSLEQNEGGLLEENTQSEKEERQ